VNYDSSFEEIVVILLRPRNSFKAAPLLAAPLLAQVAVTLLSEANKKRFVLIYDFSSV
jgi:hypothetical protein